MIIPINTIVLPHQASISQIASNCHSGSDVVPLGYYSMQRFTNQTNLNMFSNKLPHLDIIQFLTSPGCMSLLASMNRPITGDFPETRIYFSCAK